MAEWLRRGLQILVPRFDSGRCLHPSLASASFGQDCSGCRYDVKDTTGETACPFNALYWDFLDRNAGTLRGNPRLGPVYRSWDRKEEDKRQAYRDRAAAVLEGV